MEVTGLHSILTTSLFIAITSLVLTVEALCPECTKADLDDAKTACQKLAVTLIDTETNGNATHVCSALHELMLCIADKTPQCLDRVYEEYKSYRMTPWRCQLTANQTILYQERHENGCKQDVINTFGTSTIVSPNVAEVYQNKTSDPNSCNSIHTYRRTLQFVVAVAMFTIQYLLSTT